MTRLRWRIFHVSTFPAPGGTADLRPRTSTPVVVTVDRPPCGTGTSNVTVAGTTLEQPPSQPNGGGFNSTLSSGTISPATPLANGASLDLRFLLGIQQTGCFRLGLLVEALPRGNSNVVVIGGHTDGSTLTPTTAQAVTPDAELSWPAAACAASYDLYYSTSWPSVVYIGNSGGTSAAAGPLAPNVAYMFAVEGRDSLGATLGLGPADLATHTIFTDPTLTAGTTAIKAAHITELRTSVNAVRTLSGLPAASFTDAITPNFTIIRPYHITELRAALNAARSALGLSAITYTDPSLTAGVTLIKRAHVNDLREGVK